MGRAERRLQEKKDRETFRKDKILLSKKELGIWKEHVAQETSNYNVEALMTCFALAQHRLFGFDTDNIMKTLQCIDDLMGGVLDDTATLNDYITELEEAGVIIKCK